MRARFRGLDSQVEKPSRVLTTDRTALIEIPEDVLRMYVRRYQQREER